MATWEECTQRGMTEFKRQFYGNAILLHKQALNVARHEFFQRAESNASLLQQQISQVVISYFNLADCYIALDEINRASDFYLDAQGFLMDINHHLDEEVRREARHAISHLHQMWLDFLNSHKAKVYSDKLLKYYQTFEYCKEQQIRLTVCH